ncbi:hypothetical protein [Algibacter mikhailovii]|uniref:hypothetical protein n=1 Tax=Algibacter mikhailovii TaxID=425498 RepID=UPI002493D730|nr:hypothetical protein [Algibacter mikhailovii]
MHKNKKPTIFIVGFFAEKEGTLYDNMMFSCITWCYQDYAFKINTFDRFVNKYLLNKVVLDCI